ncbi:hypothetical protein E1262_25725 [Jiangella aurantiaca]|uniref:Uncharacterized protein n=1 Tax=Jiangella aurantiaca TaxID=2530373 RepID=A0A4V2YRA4_9ACTN|nr:hypothetical protein [Jiangella aurantiaca]TDD65267.1 hypothetical protein E1262_25725 [Jiangella aurantiaca]
MMAESGGRLRRLALGAPRQHLTLTGSAAGAVVLAVLVAGGFDPLEKPEADVAPLAVGEAADIGPFTVTVDRMRVVDELPGISEGDDDTRVLALVGTVTATGTTTQYGAMLSESVALDGVPGVPAEVLPGETTDPGEPVPAGDVYVMADGTRLDAVQPGLEYEVAFVWEQDARADVPSEARLVLIGRTLRQSSIDHSDEWLDPLPVVAGDIEVTEPSAEPTEPAEEDS